MSREAASVRSQPAANEHLAQPRLDSKIGLRLKSALHARHAPVDRHTVAAAVEGACACLEVVHSTWTGYRFNLEQNTADNSSAGQVVVEPRLPVTDLMALDTVAVRLSDGERTLGEGLGADADGHPLDAVARLARELAANDQRLEAGDWVITGGLTKACVLEVGGRLAGVFSAGNARSVELAVRRG